MGKYLDQCAKDAWDVIKGRKKIIGNKIIECNLTDKNIESQEENYGWLAPNGTFYSVEFGNHQAWASQYLLNEYRNGNIELECDEDPGDELCELGFILLHSPHKYDFLSQEIIKRELLINRKNFSLTILKREI